MPPKTSLPKFVYLYATGQMLALMVAVMAVTMTVPAATALAPTPWLIGLPYGMQYLAILSATYPLSGLMERRGRAIGFNISACFVILAGICAYLALTTDTFLLLVLAHFCIGIFMGGMNFYRFAVTDTLQPSLHAKAVSYTVAGGIVAAFIAPSLASFLKDISGFPEFSLAYAGMIGIGVCSLLLIKILPHASIKNVQPVHSTSLNAPALQNNPHLKKYLWTLILVAMIGQGTMNQWMLQGIMHMQDLGFQFHHRGTAIQWHVVGMFAPAFFTGHLITKFGEIKVMLSAMILYIVYAVMNITMDSHMSFTISLLLLGIGWNFAFVGGGATIAKLIKQHTLPQRWQGVTDTTIAIFAVISTNIPTILMLTIGWTTSNLLTIIICVFGFIIMAKNSKAYYNSIR